MTSTRNDIQATPASTFPLRRAFVIAVAAGLILVLAYIVLQRQTPEETAVSNEPMPSNHTLVLSETAQRNAGITIDTVQTREHRAHLEAPGVVACDETRTARIGALVEGKVVSAPVQVGERVAAGATLAEIHSHVLHDAWADYRRAQADQTRRSAEFAQAEKVTQRADRLYRDKAVSLQELSHTQVERTTAEQMLNAAKAEVRRTEEALEHLGLSPSKHRPRGESGEQIPVTSPLAGAVLEKHATNGTAVIPGMPLFVVSDLSTLWVLAEIDETQLSQVHVGLPVTLQVTAYPQETFAGTVVFIADMLDPKTRRITVRCQVPNLHGKLKPHMYATVAFGTGNVRSTLAVSVHAVQELEGKPVVFIAEESGKFSVRTIELGVEADGWREILSGVRAGERIVTTGSFLLKSEFAKPAAAEE